MFNLAENPKVRGYCHLILNALRAFTIICLVAIMVSTWAMIVRSGIIRQISFFDVATLVFIFASAAFLMTTELGLFKRYLEKNWPVFSDSHSLAWLGAFMFVLGSQLLAYFEKDRYNQKNLTMPLWRLVLSSGILAMTFGVLNVVASICIRDGNHGLTSRLIRKDGSLATADNKATMYDNYADRDAYSRDGGYSQPPASYHQEKEEEEVSRFRRATRLINPMNLPKNLHNFRKSRMQPLSEKPVISQPFMAHHIDVERGGHDDVLEDRRSPIVEDIQRPPTAMHPMHHHRASSQYSEASISRFTEPHHKNYL